MYALWSCGEFHWHCLSHKFAERNFDFWGWIQCSEPVPFCHSMHSKTTCTVCESKMNSKNLNNYCVSVEYSLFYLLYMYMYNVHVYI